MRPSTRLLIVVSFIVVCQLVLYQAHYRAHGFRQDSGQQMREIIQRLGLSDLCIATDARYIRHLSISDPLAPFMDHPGAIEHFPSSSIIVPVR